MLNSLKLINWLYVNKLSVNVLKTNYMIFSLRKNIIPIQNVYINNIVINYVTTTKFLGIIIDNKLTWCEHISHIKRKISKYLKKNAQTVYAAYFIL